jgi:serine/threonine protein kinase/WD40 repeat protein
LADNANGFRIVYWRSISAAFAWVRDMKERDIFDAALAIENEGHRATYLDQACQGNAALKEHVQGLLAAHDRLGSFLDAPPFEADAADAHGAEEPGGMIGPYKLLEKIGEGGFGIVFMAEQTRPLRRRVALKIVKPGMDTRQVIARFEAERQALALMDHPNIAKVFDAGTTNDVAQTLPDALTRPRERQAEPDLHCGRPYFVMELVRGMPITEYCDEHQLSVRQRLELFVAICHAVQHAHQKGIIHRDLKPTNVLVTLHDATAVPKVIDFGVAKALSGQLTDKTLFTGVAQMVGTPLYMSPEQTELSALDVDTRSDIYSLGVLLYELLTGTTPFEKGRLLEAGYDEMRRIIREEEPARPSTRLTTLGHLASTVATRRRSDPSALIQVCRGELDWIVMKAMEKDRRRRYETANSMAADVQRYLNDEPVSACPPSAAYRMRKFARRNEAALTAAALTAAALLLGIIASAWQAIRATDAELLAEERLEAEQAERKKATEAREEAKRRLLDSRLAQAAALRTSGQDGQRLKSWQAVTEAAQLARELGLERERLLELRDSAIASLALADVKLDKLGPARAEGWRQAFFDGDLQRYGRADSKGNINVYRMTDDRVTSSIAAPANASGPPWGRFSPDGKLLAFRHNPDLRIRLWDCENERLIFDSPYANHDAALAFRPDGRHLALGQSDGTITIHDTASGEEVIPAIKTGIPPAHLAYSPSGQQLAVLSPAAQQLQLLDVESAKPLHTFPLPAGGLQVAWHPDGILLAVGCDDRNVHLWNIETKTRQAVLQGHQTPPFAVGFAAEGDVFVSWAWDGTTRLWDTWGGTELVRFAGAAYAMSRDGRFLAGEPAYNIHRWEIAPRYEFRTLPRSKSPDSEAFEHGGISPDGRWLALGTNRGVRIWDLAWRKELTLPPMPAAHTWDIKFHPTRDELFTGSISGLHRWSFRLDSGALRIVPAQKLPLPARQSQISLDRTGRILASVDHSGGWTLDLRNVQAEARHLSHEAATFVAISPDGNLIATGTHHGQGVKVWEASNGAMLRHLIADEVGAKAGFSPDGRWLITETAQDFRLWRTDSWEQVWHVRREQTFFNNGVSFSPDGRLLALTTSLSAVQLRKPDSGEVVAALQAPHVAPISLVGFSPDGARLVISVLAGEVGMWDLRRVREQLKQIDLDWDLPEYAPERNANESAPVPVEKVEIVGFPDGLSAQPRKNEEADP